MSIYKILATMVAAMTALAALYSQTPSATPVQLPAGLGRDITQKVCGATCHGPDIIMGAGRTRDQWTGVVNAMVARGAKATDAELVQIAQYLTSHFGPSYVGLPNAKASPSPGGGRAAVPPRGITGKGPGPLGGGAADSHVVDAQGAERGKSIYIAECITCHGNKARGANPAVPANQQGADLV